MTPQEFSELRTTYQKLNEEEQDLIQRFVGQAMLSAGVQDRRQRVAVLKQLDDLKAEPA